MSRSATITKQQILDAAFEIATGEGLAALNIRSAAERCNVSVGSIYNYYHTKGQLIADVVARFWRQAIPADLMRAHPGETYLDFYIRIAADLRGVFEEFEENWLVQLVAIDKCSLQASTQLEQEYFQHIQKGMLEVLEADTTVDRSIFGADLQPEQLCSLSWGSIMMSLRNPELAETFAAVLRRTLYGPARPAEGDAL